MARDSETRDRDEGRDATSVTPRRWRQPTYGSASNPFSLMRHMAEDMDRIFGDVGFGGTGSWSPSPFDRWSGGSNLEQLWSPQVESFRRGDQLVIRADLPGLNKENVNVEIENDVLQISGERREEKEEDRDEYYRSERSYGRFFRAIQLPDGVNPEQVNAQFRDGVLEVTLPAPKAKPQGGKRIDIK